MDHLSSTLRQVLETTEQLAAEIGCQNTTLQEIIKRSGISKGAIYHYVQSKDELFGLILQGHMERKVAEHHGKAAHPHEMAYSRQLSSNKLGPISIIVKGLLQPANEKQIVLRRCFIYLLSKQEQPDVAQILANLHQSWIDFTAMWIKACQKNGMIPSDIHPHKTAALIISILFGLMVQKSIAENRTNAEESAVDTTIVLELISKILGLEA